MYQIKENNLFIHDKPKSWENFSEKDLRNYLVAGYEIFKEKLEKSLNENGTLTNKEEKELKYMLEALIDAKKLL